MSFSFNGAGLFLRRAYTVGVENVKVQPVGSVMRKVVEGSKGSVVGVEGVEKEVFWMRDPKTGNWVPETHFNQVDATELREKFLSKATKP